MTVPYIQLELRKDPPATSHDALDRVVEALKVTQNCKDLKTTTYSKDWKTTSTGNGNEFSKVTQENCRVCRKPGHWAKNCPQSKYNQNYKEDENKSNQMQNYSKPSISNVIVNSVIEMESLEGTCLINGKPVNFLFDTGTIKTIISSKTWDYCRRKNDVVFPVSSTLETCNGGPMRVIGSASCIIKIKDFETKICIIY